MGVPRRVVEVIAASHQFGIHVVEVVVPPEKRHPVRMLLLESDDVFQSVEILVFQDIFEVIRVQIVPEEDELPVRVFADRLSPEIPAVHVGYDDEPFHG